MSLKKFIVQKVLFIGIVLFVMPSNKARGDISTFKRDTVIKPLVKENTKVINIIKDSIDVNQIIKDARQSVEEYKAISSEKAKVNKEALELSKIELENMKTRNYLVEKIIKEYKNKTKDDVAYNMVKRDSICTRSVKYLLKRNKVCKEWEIQYYVMKGNKKVILEVFKNKD